MSDIVQTPKELAQQATAKDLTDEEIQKAVQILHAIQKRYRGREATEANLNSQADEIKTKLAEIGILATVGPGADAEVEIIGSVRGSAPFDHERKSWEVNTANERGEDYRGQKEAYNVTPKKRAARQSYKTKED